MAHGRRSSEEVTEAILTAARSQFAARGFDGARMQDVAEAAGVYEPMVYRRFPSKTELFRAAVTEPLRQGVETFLDGQAAWTGSQAAEAQLRSYLEPLYTMLVEHRENWIAFVGAPAEDFDVVHDRPLNGLGLCWLADRLLPNGGDLAALGAFSGGDATHAGAIIFSMVLGMALMEPYMTAHSTPLDRSVLIDQMVRFALGPAGSEPRAGHDPHDATEAPAQLDGGPGAVSTRVIVEELLRHVSNAERRAIEAELQLERLMNGVREDGDGSVAP